MNPLHSPLARSAGLNDYRGTKPADNPLLNPPKEAWVIHAYRGGQSINLTPEFFRFARSRDEARELAMERVKHDLDFRRLFKGYRLQYVRFDDCLEIR